MPTLGKRSLEHFATLHPDLQRVVEEAIKVTDFTVLVGHRGEAEQNAAFAAGKSKLKWPKSAHNTLPSDAVDLAPYPIDWSDRERFCYLAGVVMACAARIGVKLRWGGDWNGNGVFSDETFSDLPHFELA